MKKSMKHEGKKSMHKTHKSAERSHKEAHHRGAEGHSKGFVTGHDEGVGSGDFANLPQGVVMREFPKSPMPRGGYLDDTLTGIDQVNQHSEKMRGRYVSNQK